MGLHNLEKYLMNLNSKGNYHPNLQVPCLITMGKNWGSIIIPCPISIPLPMYKSNITVQDSLGQYKFSKRIQNQIYICLFIQFLSLLSHLLILFFYMLKYHTYLYEIFNSKTQNGLFQLENYKFLMEIQTFTLQSNYELARPMQLLI